MDRAEVAASLQRIPLAAIAISVLLTGISLLAAAQYDDVASEAAMVSVLPAELESMTEGVVTAVGSEFSEAATAVYLRVGANGAPWRCLVSSDGSNPSVMFMGDEGAL